MKSMVVTILYSVCLSVLFSSGIGLLQCYTCSMAIEACRRNLAASNFLKDCTADFNKCYASNDSRGCFLDGLGMEEVCPPSKCTTCNFTGCNNCTKYS